MSTTRLLPEPMRRRASDIAGAPDEVDRAAPTRDWGDQWLRVSEKVLRGLNHKLTNRVAALEAVVGVVDPGGPPDPELMGALANEVQRLHRLLQLYRLMPADLHSPEEVALLQDVVPQVLELHRHHADLREIPVDVTIDPATEPVLIKKSALFRCLLIMLESGAGNAMRSGRESTLSIDVRPERSRISVTLEGPYATPDMPFDQQGDLLRALRAALRHAHGRVDARVHDARLQFRVVLPTLAESRRREATAL